MLTLASASSARPLVSRSASTSSVLTALACAALASPARCYAIDALNKREQSEEAAYVRKLEQEKSKKLRESIAKQKTHLEEAEKTLDDMSSSQKK
ncbi:hypothetical protein OC846_001913 [Tilletia horrida]|uniref:ATPase inhibitor, mitochondrial n=1 Tax=Tilletia horrida TaxID=155126 RepID=A0AAN6GT27_9BASI|nr:hypothetical protein OC846_001913 [Tilletia horrida]KAK0568324.1 hypothetical protein OC861_002035 [Tilletia horrida]